MGQLNLGVFWGYQNNSDYGKFNVLFNYTANGCTLSSMNIKLSKTVDYKYTTNSYIVDSVKVGGTSFSYSPSSGDLSGYTTKGGGPQINLSGSITVSGTSAAVEIKMHRTGQSANAQVFTGTISGLATAPTGLTCSVSNVTETSVTLSGSYSSNGGTEVTSSGYQYKIDGGSWANCTSSVTGLSPTKKYYFRYYATNIVDTSYSSEVSATMYDYPKPTTMENFLIGNGPRITLSNPLRRTVTLQILQHSTNTVLGTYSGNYDGVIQSEFATASAVDSQYQSIPNSKSGTYYCKVTYSNISTKTLGESSSYTYSIKQIDAEYPTFTTSNVKNLTNNSSHTGLGDTSKFIKGFNSLTGTISKMTLNKHANGDKYNISATGLSTVSVNYSTSDVNFTLGNITNKSFTVTAVDKRGLSRTVTIDLGSNFIDYFKPYIQNGTITRQNGIGTAAIISFSGKYMNWSGLSVSNSIVSIRYKVGSSGSWTNMPSNASLSSSGGTWTLSATLTNTFDVSTKYDIYLEIKDKLGNVASGAVVTSSAYQLGTADALLWRDLSNKRLGIRTKPSYTLDVNGDFGISGQLKTQLKRESGGSWILARDNATVSQIKHTTSSGSSWNPVVGVKTANGFWSIGNVGNDNLAFSYDTDANYNASPKNNTSTVVNLPNTGGTIALTSQIPSVANMAKTNVDNNFSTSQSISGNITVNNGFLQSVNNGVTTKIGAGNSSFTHYYSNSGRHWFDHPVYVAGDVYAGSGYNRQLAYNDEVGSSIGTSGIWRYIKWNNGYALCIGRQTVSTKISTAWGGIYESGDVTLNSYPFTFTELPYVIYQTHPSNSTAGGGGYSSFIMSGQANTTTTAPGKINLLRGRSESTARNYDIVILAFGKWK